MKCSCAKVMYRNNYDGTRDHKIVGDLRCLKCRGKGRCVICPFCTGAGMLLGARCEHCLASGHVPARPAPLVAA